MLGVASDTWITYTRHAGWGVDASMVFVSEWKVFRAWVRALSFVTRDSASPELGGKSFKILIIGSSNIDGWTYATYSDTTRAGLGVGIRVAVGCDRTPIGIMKFDLRDVGVVWCNKSGVEEESELGFGFGSLNIGRVAGVEDG